MSTSLKWTPEYKKWTSLKIPKSILHKRNGFHVEYVFTDRDVPYLEGLKDADVPGAQDLIVAIAKYDSVLVREME